MQMGRSLAVLKLGVLHAPALIVSVAQSVQTATAFCASSTVVRGPECGAQTQSIWLVSNKKDSLPTFFSPFQLLPESRLLASFLVSPHLGPAGMTAIAWQTALETAFDQGPLSEIDKTLWVL